ncbi:MAG: aspartate ammonia-lyase, partial [Halanaerobium sp. MSAO_Bac5]
GEKKLAAESYFGINTIRALENFSLSRKKVHPDLIKSIAMIKYAAAQTNQEIDLLETDKAEAIKSAAQEIIEGEFDHLFKLDALQGGAGTSSNMMVNEIIANRALEIMGHQKGEYKYLHPNDDVNKGQSTNDVYPTALRIAVLNLLKKLTESIANLQDALQKKEKEFAGVIKLARTQLQDAVPITLGQEFSAYAEAVNRDRWRLYKITDRLKKINLGGTAVGTGLNTSWAYIYKIAKNIRAVSGLSLAHSENMIDITQNMDIFVEVSGLLKSAAVNLNKIANDLRLLASGPKGGLAEISLSEVQAGSSIMPGKVNPVICEMINQLVIEVISGDQAITLAAKEGQLELNAFAPSIAHHLLTMIEEMTNGIDIFINKTITKVEANPERCRELLEGSLAQLTALVPHIGYDNAVKIAKKVLKDDNKNIKELIVEEGLLSEAQLEELLTVEKMTGLYNL